MTGSSITTIRSTRPAVSILRAPNTSGLESRHFETIGLVTGCEPGFTRGSPSETRDDDPIAEVAAQRSAQAGASSLTD